MTNSSPTCLSGTECPLQAYTASGAACRLLAGGGGQASTVGYARHHQRPATAGSLSGGSIFMAPDNSSPSKIHLSATAKTRRASASPSTARLFPSSASAVKGIYMPNPFEASSLTSGGGGSAISTTTHHQHPGALSAPASPQQKLQATIQVANRHRSKMAAETASLAVSMGARNHIQATNQ